MSAEKISQLSVLLGPLISSNLRSLLLSIPSLAKYIVWLLLLLNIRSWPFVWHLRVFKRVTIIRLQYKWFLWRNMFKSRAARLEAEDKWLDSITPVGADPFNLAVSYRSWASIDDSDFNIHLSNSSYAKTLDPARFKAALAMFPMFFRAGGRMALAGTHFNFIREIPILAPYEVRVSIGSWDHKWIYVVSKFVTKPSNKRVKPKVVVTPPSQSEGSNGFPSSASLSTPAELATSSPGSGVHLATGTAHALKAVAESLVSTSEPDGATLHTISVSQCCFKVGRITVPPALVLAINGFSRPPPKTDIPYSAANPPPNWKSVKVVMSEHLGGSTKALNKLIKGGWRDIPEGEGRWWDVAMGGPIEEKRVARLEAVKGLSTGMAGARSL